MSGKFILTNTYLMKENYHSYAKAQDERTVSLQNFLVDWGSKIKLHGGKNFLFQPKFPVSSISPA